MISKPLRRVEMIYPLNRNNSPIPSEHQNRQLTYANDIPIHLITFAMIQESHSPQFIIANAIEIINVIIIAKLGYGALDLNPFCPYTLDSNGIWNSTICSRTNLAQSSLVNITPFFQENLNTYKAHVDNQNAQKLSPLTACIRVNYNLFIVLKSSVETSV